jgi:competence protein ComEC
MPLFWLSTAFVLGLVLGSGGPQSWGIWAGIAGLLVTAAVFERRILGHRLNWYPSWRDLSHLPLALVLVAVALGGLRYVTAQPVWGENDLAWYHAYGEFRLSGVIQQPPDVNDSSTVLIVAVDQLAPLVAETVGPAQAVHGLVRVTLRTGQAWRYGDRIELEGFPVAPQQDDSSFFADYLARRDIYTVLEFPKTRFVAHDAGSPFWAWLYALRGYADRTMLNLLPQPEAALLNGVVLGGGNLPDNVAQAFRDTGIAHIIAVSGFNVAIVSQLFTQQLGRMLRARFAVPLAILAITGYCLLTGGSPSVVRAGIMGAMGALGPMLGRRQVGVNSLAFTAGVMCLFGPQLPWDISFQLSFAATLGLVLYAEPMQQALVSLLEARIAPSLARRLAGPVGEYFLFTLAAQIFTLPVTAVHFQRVSLSAVLTNPLVLPPQPLAMILGGLALLLGMAWLPLGQLLAWLCWPLLAYTIRVAELLAQLPYSQLNLGRLSLAVVLVYYLGLLLLALPPARRCLRSTWKPAMALVLAGLLAMGLWRVAIAAPDGRLHLDVLNLPGGPALFLRTPGGQDWLINGSSQSDALADAVGRRILPLEGRLDGLVITTGGAAPLQSIANLVETSPPRLVASSLDLAELSSGKRLLAQLKAQGVSQILLESTPVFDLGRGATLRVLASTSEGTALWLEWAGFRALLPGGVKPADLPQPLPAGVTLLVLSPADLPSENAYLTPEDWADIFQPQAVVVTGTNPALPGWIALDEYRWVSLHSDGQKLWVEGERLGGR